MDRPTVEVGRTQDDLQGYGLAGDPAAGDVGDATCPVGSGKADRLGLYDMRGNGKIYAFEGQGKDGLQ